MLTLFFITDINDNNAQIYNTFIYNFLYKHNEYKYSEVRCEGKNINVLHFPVDFLTIWFSRKS